MSAPETAQGASAFGNLPGTEGGPALRLTNARLVLPEKIVDGSLVVEDGVIAELRAAPLRDAGAIDCRGAYLLPGLVELHTDNLERHLEPRPAVDWPHLPAILAHDCELASTGITTVFDALRVGSILSDNGHISKYARAVAREIIDARAAGALKISHMLHLRAETCSETLLEELAEFGPQDRIGIVSLMDHTPGQRQFRDLARLKTYIGKKRAMTDDGFEAHVERLRTLRARFGTAHEAGAVAEARRLGAVLGSHDDTTAAHVAASQAKGVAFAEFPTTIEAARACRAAGIAIMMGAPNIIRGASHSGNVSALELAERGLVDIVSSDYAPAALLLAAFRLADLWDDLPRAIRAVTAAPARISGLPDRGALALGLRADLACVSAHGAPQGTAPILRAAWSRGRQVA